MEMFCHQVCLASRRLRCSFVSAPREEFNSDGERDCQMKFSLATERKKTEFVVVAVGGEENC